MLAGLAPTNSPLILTNAEVSDTQQMPHHRQLSSWQCLCQRISFLLISAHSLDNNLTPLHTLPDEMILDINMLASSMKHRVLHEIYCRVIVDIESHCLGLLF